MIQLSVIFSYHRHVYQQQLLYQVRRLSVTYARAFTMVYIWLSYLKQKERKIVEAGRSRPLNRGRAVFFKGERMLSMGYSARSRLSYDNGFRTA